MAGAGSVRINLSEAQEREQIRKAIASLQKSVGQRPEGWYCRYGPSLNTRRLLVEEGGFAYDSDSYADELPFWQDVAGKPHLIVPYSLAHNDGKFVAQTGTASQWYEFIRDGFDMLYRESARHPRMMSVGMHLRLIGNPSRAVAMERLLDHVMNAQGCLGRATHRYREATGARFIRADEKGGVHAKNRHRRKRLRKIAAFL